MIDVLFGKGTLKDILEVIFWIDIIKLGFLIYIAWVVTTLKKDNGFFWKAMKKLLGDMPN